MRAPPCCRGRGTRASAAGCGKIFGPPDAERPADWTDQSFASARSAPCAKGLSTRAAGHQRYAGQLGRGLIRRRGDRCEQYSRRITHTAAKYKGRNYGVITGQSNYDSNYPDEKWRRAPLLWEEAPITGRSHRGEYATSPWPLKRPTWTAHMAILTLRKLQSWPGSHETSRTAFRNTSLGWHWPLAFPCVL